MQPLVIAWLAALGLVAGACVVMQQVLIAGQMLTSLLFDHFGLFRLAQQSANLTRIVGAGLLIAGVVLIRV
jgi:uncharacterized membrane protein YdcZ (DUF606 family)